MHTQKDFKQKGAPTHCTWETKKISTFIFPFCYHISIEGLGG